MTIFAKFRFQILFVCLLALLVYSCANPLSPQGGPKDEDPPIVLETDPPQESINFNENKFRIFFDEYVNIKDANENVIVSPPMEHEISYLLRAKSLLVKFSDTLMEETTYTFSFGDAIADITENNPAPNLRYVFSTGDNIDSFYFSGKLLNAYTLEAEPECWIMLYTENIDSLPYTVRPIFVSKTLEDGSFEFFNLPDKKFKVFALKDANSNYLYDMNEEGIAFTDSLLRPFYPWPSTKGSDSTIFSDSTFFADSAFFADSLPKNNGTRPLSLYMFEETDSTQFISEYKTIGPQQLFIHLLFPEESPRIKILSNSISRDMIVFEKNKSGDSLHIWLKKAFSDSIKIAFYGANGFGDTLKFTTLGLDSEKKKGKQLSPQSLRLSYTGKSLRSLDYLSQLRFRFEYPIDSGNSCKCRLIENEDTLFISSYLEGPAENYLKVDYQWKEGMNYNLMIPGQSFRDIRGLYNDTSFYKFRTTESQDYGQCNIRINNYMHDFPALIYLLDEEGSIKRKKQILSDTLIEFPHLSPANYRLKMIFDKNNNKQWDRGDYLKNLQPERVIIFEKELMIRGNWINEEDWLISYPG